MIIKCYKIPIHSCCRLSSRVFVFDVAGPDWERGKYEL